MPWTIPAHEASAVEAIDRGLMEGDLDVLADVPEPAQSSQHQARVMALAVLNRQGSADTREWGVKADGKADDTDALVKAFSAVAAGEVGSLTQPLGTSIISGPVQTQDASVFVGSGTASPHAGPKSTIKLVSPEAALIVSHQGCIMERFEVDGSDIAERGVVFHNAGRGDMANIYVKRTTVSGFEFNNEYAAGYGNNDTMQLRRLMASNCGVGFNTPHLQSDNNVITTLGCEAWSNDSHGMVWKGHGQLHLSPITFFNGGNGGQFGEAADTSWSTENLVINPYCEGNRGGATDSGWVGVKVVQSGVIGGAGTKPSGPLLTYQRFDSSGEGMVEFHSGARGEFIRIEPNRVAARSSSGRSNLRLAADGTGEIVFESEVRQ